MTTTLTTPAMSGKEIVDLSRKHTLYEWSAQSKVDPIPVASAKGFTSTRRKASASSTSTASSCRSTSDTATSA
jgi:hypothetical protein